MTAAMSPVVYSSGFHPYLNSVVRPAGSNPIKESSARIMRPEIQTQLDNAKQSIGLLRRHL